MCLLIFSVARDETPLPGGRGGSAPPWRQHIYAHWTRGTTASSLPRDTGDRSPLRAGELVKRTGEGCCEPRHVTGITGTRGALHSLCLGKTSSLLANRAVARICFVLSLVYQREFWTKVMWSLISLYTSTMC